MAKFVAQGCTRELLISSVNHAQLSIQPLRKTAMNIIFEAGRLLSVGSIGVFAGAMLTEGLVLVPYWRSLRPAEFFAWYSANGQRLQGFFGPLTAVTALLSIASALLSLWQGHPGRWPTVLAAALLIAVVSTFYLYFRKANASFTAASISDVKLGAELTRWATWHWWRVGLSFAASVAAMMPRWHVGYR
jgi:hypothetical protein